MPKNLPDTKNIESARAIAEKNEVAKSDHQLTRSPARKSSKIPEDDSLNAIRCITRPELRALLGGISERTLQRLEEINDAPPKIWLSAGRIGYRITAVQEWLDSRQVQP